MKKEIKEEKEVCCCGEEFSENEIFEFEGDIYCEGCLNDITFICSHCNERYLSSENCGDSHRDLCEDCFDNHYIKCEGCGRIISNEVVYYLDDDYDNETDRN